MTSQQSQQSQLNYYPKIVGISPHKIKQLDGGLFVIPSWGIRRNISYRLNYEMAVGFGVDFSELFEIDDTDFIVNIHLRIGLKFKK